MAFDISSIGLRSDVAVAALSSPSSVLSALPSSILIASALDSLPSTSIPGFRRQNLVRSSGLPSERVEKQPWPGGAGPRADAAARRAAISTIGLSRGG